MEDYSKSTDHQGFMECSMAAVAKSFPESLIICFHFISRSS